ncbi:MAG: triple tyrosine motif-containing protein [Reichenbachiella sp.]|uniref:ligand-binding sensor domain-containing protein n=1 Tax=Reichenbachiella sp. TaxID=2184521 RepID=UPI0032663246
MLSNRSIATNCLFLFAYLTTSAQEVQSVRLSQFRQNNGLSSNYVTKIQNDGYGFLWIGTQEGLNVFDGSYFLTFSNQSDSNQNIGGSLVQDLIEDHKRSLLWVQTAFGPVCAFDLRSRTITRAITQDGRNQPYSEVWARCFGLHEDVLWIGGLNTISAYHIPSNSFLNINHIEMSLVDKGEYNINKITHDVFGNTWLMMDGSGVVIVNESMEIIKSFDANMLDNGNDQKLFFWDVVTDGEHIYMASSWGLLHLKTAKAPEEINLIRDTPRIFSETAVMSLASVSGSVLLLSTTDNVFKYNLKEQKVQRLVTTDEAHQGIANVFEIVYVDTTDQVWLGTQSGLLSFSYGNSPFTSFSQSEDSDLKINHLYALLPESDHKILAGGSNGVYEIDELTSQIVQLDTAKTNFLIFKDNEKNVFVSSASDLFVLKDGQRVPPVHLKNIPSDLNGNRLNAAINYNDSLIILSSFVQKGFTVWNTNHNHATTFHHDSIQGQIPELRSINNLFKSRNRDVLVLSSNSVVRFNPINNDHGTYVLKKPISNKRLNNFMDMNESEDSYFLGTYGDGLIETDKQFNVKRIYTTHDGLSNDCIYRVFNVDDKKMVMTSNNGLSILDLETGKTSTYYEGDGLHGNGFEQFCGYQKDNKIYAGGPGGFTVINTDLLPTSNPAPVLYPTGIQVDTPEEKIDSTDLFMSSFTIPNDAFKTTLNFVSPDYKNPQRMTYRYKIKELSKDWVLLGNQNFVDLIGINPGTYHFEVQATNSLGMDSVPLEIKLDFLPKWYQTHWFKVVMLLAVALLIYFIQRYRMIQIQKQQQIRTEIANDLHDDIGSTLNSLKIFTHLAQYEPENKDHLLQIEESITSATVGLRDMIWVLEDEQDTVYEVMERIQKFAQPICLANTIEFKTHVNADSDLYISKKVKRNFLLIAKECINNSMKYAQCNQIVVSLEHSKSGLIMIIEDDGIGFDTNEVTRGKGLESIQYRAKQIQFECKIEALIGQGTRIELIGKRGK